jgi:hypothetical protein
MPQIDSKENSVVAVYAQHSDAENAINLLKKRQKIRLSATTPPATG